MEFGFVDHRDMFGDSISNTTCFRRTLLFRSIASPKCTSAQPITPRKEKKKRDSDVHYSSNVNGLPRADGPANFEKTEEQQGAGKRAHSMSRPMGRHSLPLAIEKIVCSYLDATLWPSIVDKDCGYDYIRTQWKHNMLKSSLAFHMKCSIQDPQRSPNRFAEKAPTPSLCHAMPCCIYRSKVQKQPQQRLCLIRITQSYPVKNVAITSLILPDGPWWQQRPLPKLAPSIPVPTRRRRAALRLHACALIWLW